MRSDLARMYGPLVQLIILWVSRGGWLHLEPTFYVVGADTANQTIHQAVSLGTRNPRRWQFPPETMLDNALAIRLLDQLRSDSPISFTATLDDAVIEQGLHWFGRDKLHWSADLFLAFFNMTRGAPSARDDLARAFDLFRRHSRLSMDEPLVDWEERLRDRFLELQARLDSPDCISLCRADAEAHAKALGLPPIIWPPEWPEHVPPWLKNESSSGLVGKLSRLFK